MATALTERDLELIEVALESAISATESSLFGRDDVASLNQEYRQALAHIQLHKETGADTEVAVWTPPTDPESDPFRRTSY